jgi:hypothetical protein
MLSLLYKQSGSITNISTSTNAESLFVTSKRTVDNSLRFTAESCDSSDLLKHNLLRERVSEKLQCVPMSKKKKSSIIFKIYVVD